MRTIVAVLAAAYAVCALADDVKREPLERDPGRFIESLLSAVPRGSPMQKAYDFVEARGFENCVPHTKDRFSPRALEEDFVLCSREYSGTVYEIALFHDGAKFQRAGMKMRSDGKPKE